MRKNKCGRIWNIWLLFHPFLTRNISKHRAIHTSRSDLDLYLQPIRRQDFRCPPMRRRVGWLVRCQSGPPLSFVRLSAASRPHPSPATRNKTSTWLIDDTTRKGGIHMEQEDFHGAKRRDIMKAEYVLGIHDCCWLLTYWHDTSRCSGSAERD